MSSELPEPPRAPGASDRRAARTPRRRGLTRAQIIDAAMAIVDADGLDALTMRSLATALGTGAASLYAYVGSKEELVEALVERAIGEMRFEGSPQPDHWREQVKATANSMREVWGRHGDLARASFARIPLGENALAGSEWLISVMRAGGLSDRVVGLAVDLLSLYIGAIAYEDSLEASEGRDEQQMQEFAVQLERYFAALPADRFPNLVSLAAALTVPEDRFEFGLDVILAGLAALDAYQ